MGRPQEFAQAANFYSEVDRACDLNVQFGIGLLVEQMVHGRDKRMVGRSAIAYDASWLALPGFKLRSGYLDADDFAPQRFIEGTGDVNAVFKLGRSAPAQSRCDYRCAIFTRLATFIERLAPVIGKTMQCPAFAFALFTSAFQACLLNRSEGSQGIQV